MMKELNIKRFLSVILMLLVLCLISWSVYCFASGNVPIYEDCAYMILRKNDFVDQFFINVYHGRYISNFIVCMLGSVIPKLFGLHPITFFRTVGPVLKGILLFALYFQICRYLYRNKNYDLFMPFIILLMYIHFQFIFAFHYQDVEYCSFYGFIFPFLFFNLFWHKFISYTENKSQRDFYLLILYAFILGISTEFTNIVSYIALLIIFFFKKGLRKTILFPFISLSTAVGLYYTNNESLLNSHTLHTKGSIFSGMDSFMQLPVYVKPFFDVMKDLLINEYGVYLLFIIFLSVIIYLQYRNFDKLILPVSLMTGSLVFGFLLIGDPECGDGSWLRHFDIVYQYKIFFSIIIFYLLGLVQIKNILKHLIIFILFSVLICMSAGDKINFIKDIKSLGLKNAIVKVKKENMAEQLSVDEIGYLYHGKNRYLYERINLYNLKNNLPLSAIYNNVWHLYAIYISDRDVCSEIQNLSYVYNLKVEECNFRKFYSIDDAYNQYLKDGGQKIPEEEIELADFQKLKEAEEQ